MKISLSLLATSSTAKGGMKEWEVQNAFFTDKEIVLSNTRSNKQWHDCGKPPSNPANAHDVKCVGNTCIAVCPIGWRSQGRWKIKCKTNNTWSAAKFSPCVTCPDMSDELKDVGQRGVQFQSIFDARNKHIKQFFCGDNTDSLEIKVKIRLRINVLNSFKLRTKVQILNFKNPFRANCTRTEAKRKMWNVFAKMARMVTPHGKNLAVGLLMMHLGHYRMLKAFNANEEPVPVRVSLTLSQRPSPWLSPRLDRPLPRVQLQLRLHQNWIRTRSLLPPELKQPSEDKMAGFLKRRLVKSHNQKIPLKFQNYVIPILLIHLAWAAKNTDAEVIFLSSLPLEFKIKMVFGRQI